MRFPTMIDLVPARRGLSGGRMRRTQKLSADKHLELLVVFYVAVAVVTAALTAIFW